MRVVVTEFRQESNSLSPFTSGFEHWRSGWMLSSDALRAHHEDAESAVRGMLEVLAAAPEVEEIIPGPAYYSQSGGTAEQEVMDAYLDELIAVLRSCGPVDAVCFSFHGALQTTDHDDAEAEVAARVRKVVGEDCILVASADLHGFVSRRTVEQIDALCGYHTYPHRDFVETGRRAARSALRMFTARESSVGPPRMAWAPVPMMVSASAYSTLEGPFADLMEQGQQLVDDGRILDFSIFQMQPWLDVSDPCSAVLTIAADDKSACEAAESMAAGLYAARRAFEPRLYSVDDVISRAQSADAELPVVLVDSADSPNAGAAADSMAVAARVHELGAEVRLATVVMDPEAVAAAFAAGIGARITRRLGGSLDERAVTLEAEYYVRSLHDGRFRNAEVGSAGSTSSLGRAAVLQLGPIDILACEHLVSPGDPQLYAGFGMPQSMYDIVVVKANTSFRSAYRAIASEVMDADTPGAAGANIRELPFTRIPRTVYPWADAPFTPRAEVLRAREAAQ